MLSNAARSGTALMGVSILMSSGSFLFGECVKMPGAPNVQRVVRDGRSRRYSLPEFRIGGHDLRPFGPDAQDGHGAVVERGEVDVLVGGDGGGIVPPRGGALLKRP